MRAIVKKLTLKNIPPRKGKHWHTSTLHGILTNETYTGTAYYNKNYSVETKSRNGNKYRKTKNTGSRLRPKEKWIPIPLPDSLKIISRDIFDSAQKQLQRNFALSPRNNKKYQYLLRNLVRCGKCDCVCYGKNVNGYTYYQCSGKDKMFPIKTDCSLSVTGLKLENAVWEKFCEAIQNPQLITTQVIKLQDKARKSNHGIEGELRAVEKKISNMQTKEDRILDAYRENVIDMNQLKEQMAIIQREKNQLENEKQELAMKQQKGFPQVSAKTIEDYCKLISQRLNGLREDFEGKRYLLSLAINKVVVEGKNVKIKGIIPCASANTSDLSIVSMMS